MYRLQLQYLDIAPLPNGQPGIRDVIVAFVKLSVRPTFDPVLQYVEKKIFLDFPPDYKHEEVVVCRSLC